MHDRDDFKQRLYVFLGIVAVLLLFCAWFVLRTTPSTSQLGFDGQLAYQNVLNQVSLGPRTYGSDAHQVEVNWLLDELHRNGWQADVQTTNISGHEIKNVVAKFPRTGPWIILGVHYDSRLWADQDPDVAKRNQPVPGANDGASGVSVLLELARIWPKTDSNKNLWLVFFDSEDNGDIPGWDWIEGSSYFASQLTSKPDSVIILDMIGDKNLDIYREQSSNQELVDQIWNTAANLGYSDAFLDQIKYNMIDDHTPFLRNGIRAVDIIDFDYLEWHTTHDTVENVSIDSLQIVGNTIYQWLLSTPPQ